MPADALAPGGARSSADTVMNTKLHMIFFQSFSDINHFKYTFFDKNYII